MTPNEVMRWLMAFLIVLIVVWANPACAEDRGLWLGTVLYSEHFDKDTEYNEGFLAHDAVILGYDRWFIGRYRNSEWGLKDEDGSDRYSGYTTIGGYKGDFDPIGPGMLGWTLAGVKGYSWSDEIPGNIGMVASLDYRWSYFEVSVVPAKNGLVFIGAAIPLEVLWRR